MPVFIALQACFNEGYSRMLVRLAPDSFTLDTGFALSWRKLGRYQPL